MYSIYVIEKDDKIFYRYRRKLDKTYIFREIEKNLSC